MYNVIYSNKFMQEYTGANPPRTRLGSLAGPTLKIFNFTKYGLAVMYGEEQIDYLPPYQYLVMQNNSSLEIRLDTAAGTDYNHPLPFVAVKAIGAPMPYATGVLVQVRGIGEIVNVAGNMNIANTPAVNIAGTANVAIQGTVPVTLSGTGNQVNIANTPAVTVSGTPNVNVANTAINVQNAAGAALTVAGQVNIGNTPAVTVNGTVNTNITSGTVNATIQNASLNSNVTNAKLSTNELILIESITWTTGTLAPNGITRIPDGPAGSSVTGIYDKIYLVITSALGYGNYTISKLANGVYYLADPLRDFTHYTSFLNPVYTTKTASQVGGTYVVEVDWGGSPELANHCIANITNAGAGSVVNDTLTAVVYGRQASNVITNKSFQPIPTTGNYYGTGADGAFNPPATTNISNPANQAAIYNYTSINIGPGVTINFNNPAKYTILYSIGDVVINGALNSANALQNTAGGNQIFINGKAVPKAGNGGNGGAGGVGANAGAAGGGGGGGAGNYWAPGNGGGGGGGGAGGGPGNAGASGGTGYGNAAAGFGGSGATNAPTYNGAPLIIVAGGSITIIGSVLNAGWTGGRGADGAASGGNGGGGGACGNDAGGSGGSPSTGFTTGGGGGAGGSGGGVVFLFAAGSVNISGTVNINAGGGGGPGTGTNAGGNGGQAGQAGNLTIFQMGGTLGV